MAYPSNTGKFEEADYGAALTRLKLERLVPMLDVAHRWDHELSEDEQQTLAFARLLLHSPPWVLIDEVLDSLDDDARQTVLDLFGKDLERTGVIHIGRADAHDHVFSRVLHLVKDPDLRRLQPAASQPATSH